MVDIEVYALTESIYVNYQLQYVFCLGFFLLCLPLSVLTETSPSLA